MSKLSGPEIVRQIGRGAIDIDPFDRARINPNSYNLRLGDRLLVYNVSGYRHIVEEAARWADDMSVDHLAGAIRHEGRHEGRTVPESDWCLDMKKENPTTGVVIPPDGLVLMPNVLYLGHTMEYTATSEFVPMIEGRSSVGRLGISIHETAGFGDTGFRGDWTLEITVRHPIRVYAGVEVCQIAYEPLIGDRVPYAGRYQDQRGPKASRLWQSFLPQEPT